MYNNLRSIAAKRIHTENTKKQIVELSRHVSVLKALVEQTRYFSSETCNIHIILETTITNHVVHHIVCKIKQEIHLQGNIENQQMDFVFITHKEMIARWQLWHAGNQVAAQTK